MSRHPFPASLPVLHGAPLIHRPRQAREDRLTIARISTECAVGRGSEKDLRLVHRGAPERHAFYERDGEVWARVRLAKPRVRPTELTPAAFVNLLVDEALGDDQFNLAFRGYFARTPLGPRDMFTGRHVAFEAKRAQGEDLPARGPGLVVEDGRERAARDLARFLAEEVLVTETAVYARCPRLVRAVPGREGEPLSFVVEPSRAFEPQLFEGLPIPAGSWERYPGGDPGTGRRKGDCMQALEAGGFLDDHGDEDLRILANTLPAWILGSRGVSPDEGMNGDEKPRGGVPMGHLPSLRADAFRGMTGSIAAEEAVEVLSRTMDSLRLHVAHLDERGAVAWHAPKANYAGAVLRYAERFLVPRILEVPRQDAEALAGLGF